jgi:hypothetical protein
MRSNPSNHPTDQVLRALPPPPTRRDDQAVGGLEISREEPILRHGIHVSADAGQHRSVGVLDPWRLCRCEARIGLACSSAQPQRGHH